MRGQRRGGGRQEAGRGGGDLGDAGGQSHRVPGLRQRAADHHLSVSEALWPGQRPSDPPARDAEHQVRYVYCNLWLQKSLLDLKVKNNRWSITTFRRADVTSNFPSNAWAYFLGQLKNFALGSITYDLYLQGRKNKFAGFVFCS